MKTSVMVQQFFFSFFLTDLDQNFKAAASSRRSNEMSILSVKSFPCKLEQPVVVQAPNALRSFGVCVREITEVF